MHMCTFGVKKNSIFAIMQPGSFEQYLTNLACLVYIARDTDNTKIGQGDEYMTTM